MAAQDISPDRVRAAGMGLAASASQAGHYALVAWAKDVDQDDLCGELERVAAGLSLVEDSELGLDRAHVPVVLREAARRLRYYETVAKETS